MYRWPSEPSPDVLIERVQTGVRIEKRILKVLKGLAEYHDISLGDLLEGIVLHAFRRQMRVQGDSLKKIADLKNVYDLDLDASHSTNSAKASPPVSEIACNSVTTLMFSWARRPLERYASAQRQRCLKARRNSGTQEKIPLGPVVRRGLLFSYPSCVPARVFGRSRSTASLRSSPPSRGAFRAVADCGRCALLKTFLCSMSSVAGPSARTAASGSGSDTPWPVACTRGACAPPSSYRHRRPSACNRG